MSGENNESWFVFGDYEDGVHVDIASQSGDVVVKVERHLAESIIKSHNAATTRLCDEVRRLGGSSGYKS